MKMLRAARRAIAVLAAAGIIFSAQGLVSYAGTTGVGAAQPEQGGPGVETGGGTVPVVEIGPGVSEPQTPVPSQSAEPPGEPQTPAPSQPAEVQPSAPPKPEGTGPLLAVNYSGFIAQSGWSGVIQDNGLCGGVPGTWLTAFKANLVNLPSEGHVGICYQVNLSGLGWLSWAYDGAETGGPGGTQPLEALRMELTGELAEGYDLYYKVLQNGAWTPWAVNGGTAGVEGAGLWIQGIRASITARGAGEPAEGPASAGMVDPSRPMIALTFDDGPKTSVTSRILDSLQANGGRATFFMLGCNVNANAGVIQRMTAQGCEVANHTHDHKYISKLGAEGIISQVGTTNQKIAAVCGVSPTLMRPPGGFIDSASLSVLGSMGMPAIMWSIDTRDWEHRNPQKTIDIVLSQVRDGDIILMHDIYGTTADAAQVLIPALTAQGYQLVTVSELAACRGGAAPGHKYSQFR